MAQTKLDLHVHTDISFDGNHSAMYLCECAEERNIRALCFTDHCEVDTFEKDNGKTLVRQSFFEASKAKSAFCGKLLVLRGIELGEANHDPELANQIISSYPFDEVLASVHNLRDMPDFYFMEHFEKEEGEKLLRAYFDEVLELVEWGNFDVLAHLTYPLRYYYAKSGIKVPLEAYKSQTDEILHLLAEKEKALEINAAGLRQPINELAPPLALLKRFKELGGKYVTYGSDAHFAEHLCAGIDEAYTAIREAGFREITFYQQRIPMQMPLEGK